MDMCERVALLAACINALPTKDYDDVSELLERNEWGVAFETICGALYQDGIYITSQVFKDIESIGSDMNLEPELWEVLRPLVIPDEKQVWKFEELQDIKDFASYLSYILNKCREDELATEVKDFEYTCYTTSSEYLSEFRIILQKTLSEVGNLLDEATRKNILSAIEAINRAWNR